MTSFAFGVGVLHADGGPEPHLIAVVVGARHRGEDVAGEARGVVLLVEVLEVLHGAEAARARLARLELELRVGRPSSLPHRAAIWNIVSPCAMYDAAAVGLPAGGRHRAVCSPTGAPPCTAGKPLDAHRLQTREERVPVPAEVGKFGV